MSCVKRVFGYLKLTKHFPIQYDLKDKSDEILTFHCDSDFGEENESRKPRSGWMDGIRIWIYVHVE